VPPHTLEIFSECFYVFLGWGAWELGLPPFCSWHLEQENSLKTRLAPSPISKLWEEEPPSFTTGISSANKWCSFMKPSNIIFFSFLFFCCCCDGRIVNRANATSVIGIIEKQTLHWLYNEQPGTSSYSKLLATRCGRPIKMNSWTSTELTMHSRSIILYEWKPWELLPKLIGNATEMGSQ